ncbi:MAG: TolC family protein [Gammaproteobacteria bacterium]|nr:TolC family protein [Gammaproteobacteria bacterium]
MKHLSIACMVLLLAGCASFTPKPLDPEARQVAFESRRLTSSGVRQFFEHTLDRAIAPWPPKSWDLATLTLAAYYFQPGLDVAHARSLLAQAGVITAGARPNPTLPASFEYNTDVPAGISPWTNGLGIAVPIETAGKRAYRIQQAQHLAQAARLREIDRLWQARSRVRSKLLSAYPTEALARWQRDLQQEIVRLLERRFAVGFASQPEMTQAHLALNQAILALQKNRTQRAENLARVAASVGVPGNVIEGVAISFDAFNLLPSVSGLPSVDMRRQALLRRPDVLAALADYEASQSALQLEVAKQYPDISLGPGYLWDAGKVKWSLGLSLVLPLFNRNTGPIAEAEARRKKGGAIFLAIQARAIAEVEQALAGYGRAVQMVDTADTLLRNQKKKEQAVSAAYRAGETDRLALLSAQYETVTAEFTRANALMQAQQILGRLEDALRLPLGADTFVPTAARAVSLKQVH